MNDLQRLSNHELLSETARLAAEERRVSAEVLRHLREVERRRLHLELGFPTLFQFLVKHLRYTEGCAHHRIAAMRLIAEVPEAETAIRSGKLSMSTASALHAFFRREECEPARKLEVVKSVEGLSRRDCERVLADLAPHAPKSEWVWPVGGGRVEVRFEMEADLQRKLEQVRGVLGLSGPMTELLDVMADRILSLHKRRTRKGSGGEVRVSTTRYVPASLRRALWTRAGGRCEYIGTDGRRCDSRFGLQVDHIVPFAKGGHTSLENCRLLCRGHNRHEAVREFGERKMAAYR